jgi:hypothetical protein
MATTTPNYGWTVPTSTDLVKDGATAIETLGDAIDASMNTALGTKKAGMVLLNTTSFSAVASQSVNDVFSATYTNYKILVKAACSSATQLNLRMRVGGSDLTTSSYMYGGAYVAFNSATVTGENTTGTSAGFNILDVDGNPGYARIEMFDPFATEQTGVIYDQVFNSGGSRNMGYWEAFSGLTTVTTSYTGFTLIPAAGNITGTVRVYGYNQ